MPGKVGLALSVCDGFLFCHRPEEDGGTDDTRASAVVHDEREPWSCAYIGGGTTAVRREHEVAGSCRALGQFTYRLYCTHLPRDAPRSLLPSVADDGSRSNRRCVQIKLRGAHAEKRGPGTPCYVPLPASCKWSLWRLSFALCQASYTYLVKPSCAQVC